MLVLCLCLFGCSTVGETKIIPTEGGYTKITNIRPFSKKDRMIAEESLFLISKIDQNQIYPYLPESIYWASLGKEYAGLTVTFGLDSKFQHKRIYIDRETVLLNYKDHLEWLHFGALLSHELSHYFHDTEDPDTGKITNETIYRKFSEDPTIGRKFETWWKEVIKSR